MERLKHFDGIVAEAFPASTVLFADLVGFTELSARRSPESLIRLLNAIFSAFDRLVEKHGLEKIKTIGDAYMVAGGLPVPRSDHLAAVCTLALDMIAETERLAVEESTNLSLRIGVHTGPVRPV